MSTAPRPRYGRIAAFSVAQLVTATAVFGALGALPEGQGPAYAAERQEAPRAMSLSSAPQSARAERALEGGSAREPLVLVPEDSGEGRRVVFDMSRQRVWLVGDDESVRRS